MQLEKWHYHGNLSYWIIEFLRRQGYQKLKHLNQIIEMNQDIQTKRAQVTRKIINTGNSISITRDQ